MDNLLNRIRILEKKLKRQEQEHFATQSYIQVGDLTIASFVSDIGELKSNAKDLLKSPEVKAYLGSDSYNKKKWLTTTKVGDGE